MVLRKHFTIVYYFKSKEKWKDDALYPTLPDTTW